MSIMLEPAPKLVTVIVDRDEEKRLHDVLREKHVHFHYMFGGVGTASSEILKAFGLSGTEKTVGVIMEPAFKAEALLTAVIERMELRRPGHGIAFVIPISGISATIRNAFSTELDAHRERWTEYMGGEAERAGREAKHELVIALVNQGFSEQVMDAARASGARGGTVVHARRAGIEEAVKFFGVSLQAEKEIVAILTAKENKTDLMQAISKSCGMRTEARGIVISLPVEQCAGLGEDDQA
jgi:hypothetical protein